MATKGAVQTRALLQNKRWAFNCFTKVFKTHVRIWAELHRHVTVVRWNFREKKTVAVVFSSAKLNSRDATESSCAPWMLMGSWCRSRSPTNFLHFSRKFSCSCFGHRIIGVHLQLYEFSEKEQTHEWAGRVWEGGSLSGLGRWCLRAMYWQPVWGRGKFTRFK